MIFKLQTRFFVNTLNKRIHIYRRCLSGLNIWNEELSSEVKHAIENHWRDKIKTEDFNEKYTNNKYYVLSMFPYPSGSLHMGHVRVYTISDTVARYQRMNGRNVIHPIGWDAFGLPAENAAIDRQIAPNEWTKQNISYMKNQLQQLGCSFEWNRELATCDPQYYKWTQDLFLKLYDAGLVYQKEAMVNWDPVDQTVLADEQVDENGCSWRSGAKVERKALKQWFVKTTKFAKDLLDGLDDATLQDWRDIIKLQRHWIGECNGVSFDFRITETTEKNEVLSLWTSQPEYIDYVKFVAINENHILAKKEGISSKEGTVKLNSTVEHPFSKERIPVYVTSEIQFLPMSDSFVGIPDIDEEATIFAKKHGISYNTVPKLKSELEIKRQQQNICDKAAKLNVGGYWTSAKLRDWLISRQRYWGTPIPIVNCEKCGVQPVPREDLPVILPELKKHSQRGSSQLTEVTEWISTTCPKCHGPAKRETDTMDTFVDSSWYYLRYLDPANSKEMFDIQKAMKMMPVDLYIGGKEHAVLHLYYARFISHFLYSLGYFQEREPFKRLLVQGMVMGRTYRIKGTGEYVSEDKVKVLDLKKNKAVVVETGKPVVISWEKMSKSKYNGVDPDEMFKAYGTDTTRLLILADVAPTSHRNWNSNTFPGIINWQKRLWLTIRDFLKHRNNLPSTISDDQFRSHDDYMFDSRNYYVKGTSFNYLISQQLSIAVSKQQGLTNSIRRMPAAIFAHSPQFERALATQIIMLAPMAPHFASELWSGFVSAPHKLNNSTESLWDRSVLEQIWPETDMDYNLDLVCQINGCENCVVKIPRRDLDKMPKEDAIELALKQKEVQDTLRTRHVLDVYYTTYTGMENIVNILTDQPPPKKKAQEVEN